MVVGILSCTSHGTKEQDIILLSDSKCNIIVFLNLQGCLACDAYMHNALGRLEGETLYMLTNENARNRVVESVLQESFGVNINLNFSLLQGEEKFHILQRLNQHEVMRSNILLMDNNLNVIFSLLDEFGKPKKPEVLKRQLDLHAC
jgi:hypothetical protein